MSKHQNLKAQEKAHKDINNSMTHLTDQSATCKSHMAGVWKAEFKVGGGGVVGKLKDFLNHNILFCFSSTFHPLILPFSPFFFLLIPSFFVHSFIFFTFLFSLPLSSFTPTASEEFDSHSGVFHALMVPSLHPQHHPLP